MFSWTAVVVLAGLVVTVLVVSFFFRIVVPTNVVHIVQSKKKTTSYGTGKGSGNVYYRWPSSLPYIGVTTIELPVSNFDLALKDYEGYDTDRVPFKVDVVAFYRIGDTEMAAQRVKDIDELKNQLEQITQGAVRKVLAGSKIDNIMLERAKFGNAFTEEVQTQLTQWGVDSVKSMELMDIRDGHGSKVISNIMAKKTSHIEMESRTEVAKNMQVAETAEIEAKQTVEVRRQQAEQAVGERTAEKAKMVGIAEQRSQQEVLEQQKETKSREMSVAQVAQVRQAEITREQQVVAAEQDKQTRIIMADGHLQAQQKEAEAIKVVGFAKAEAEKAMQLAPVAAQIELAKEIGANEGYQGYLVSLKTVEAYIAVGSEQAKALAKADVKVISNTGDPVTGINSVAQLMTPNGGLAIGGMLEALSNTPEGGALLSAFKQTAKAALNGKGHNQEANS
ncbi:MAG: hypothetical protein HYT30_02385 [Parcubacteria group bacterium]|nr:hypothetical protein [Parcubacteria group bacterium]